MSDDTQTDHFKTFASSLEREISSFGETKDWYQRQKEQVQNLIALEVEFREHLAHSPVYGPFIYRRFISFICDEQKNILDARPFFRERQGVFAAEISKALKARDHAAMYPFGINYRFIKFVMAQRNWAKKGVFVKLANQIELLRKEIMTMNMPLAINRARLFYSRTPKSHLSQMDMIGIAAEGLMSGIDKYDPAQDEVITKQFRSTAIGRMGGNLIQDYSETLIHFYPVDKRKIYRANKLISRNVGDIDYTKLADGVNNSVKKIVEEGGKEDHHPTDSHEIADLMAAASTVSSDSSLPTDPDAPEPIERFAAPESTRPDVQFEHRDAMDAIAAALPSLNIFEAKLLRLKGISI